MLLEELAVVGLLLASAWGVFYAWHRQRQRRLARERLAPILAAEEGEELPQPAKPILRRTRWLPWAAGLAIAIALHFTLDLSWVYCGAAGLLVALLGGQLEVMLVERRTNKIENQLADAIDLMVSGLRAGAGVLNSLDNAAHESRRPLREQFEEIVGRIRLGDDAQEVFGELAARVPLESFMLFSSALSVHWEVGGSLAPTLATVGRTIRDRIELTRRIHSMTAQSRMSIIGVLLGTYAIAAIMWSNDPERMERFLVSDTGSALSAAAVAMQAVGIVWSSATARIKF